MSGLLLRLMFLALALFRRRGRDKPRDTYWMDKQPASGPYDPL